MPAAHLPPRRALSGLLLSSVLALAGCAGSDTATTLPESATAQLMSYGGDGGSLNLSVPPTFAAQWLFPRLGHFKRTLPQVSLNFVRYQHAHDFATPHEFDAAIQYG